MGFILEVLLVQKASNHRGSQIFTSNRPLYFVFRSVPGIAAMFLTSPSLTPMVITLDHLTYLPHTRRPFRSSACNHYSAARTGFSRSRAHCKTSNLIQNTGLLARHVLIVFPRGSPKKSSSNSTSFTRNSDACFSVTPSLSTISCVSVVSCVQNAPTCDLSGVDEDCPRPSEVIGRDA